MINTFKEISNDKKNKLEEKIEEVKKK